MNQKKMRIRKRFFGLWMSEDEIMELHEIANNHHLTASAYVRLKIFETEEKRN